MKNKVIAFVFAFIGAFFLYSYIEKVSRGKVTTLNNLIVQAYKCKEDKHNSYVHTIDTRKLQLFSINRDKCKVDTFNTIIDKKVAVRVVTDGVEFFQVIAGNNALYNFQSSKSLFESRQSANLLLSLIFFILAFTTLIKNYRK